MLTPGIMDDADFDDPQTVALLGHITKNFIRGVDRENANRWFWEDSVEPVSASAPLMQLVNPNVPAPAIEMTRAALAEQMPTEQADQVLRIALKAMRGNPNRWNDLDATVRAVLEQVAAQGGTQ